MNIDPSDIRTEQGNGDAYLKALGERVRDLRLRRGMTRASLARDSGVSVRYLAQLEGGEGNISINRLRQVANALALPVEDVVREGVEQTQELTLLVQFLSRLVPEQLAEARKLLLGAFEKKGRRERIALIGLRGAGKSTLGKLLAAERGVPFIELATTISRAAGMTLPEIFSLYGQAAYRRYERRALEWVIENHERFVLSVGGSLVTEPATFDELLSSCFTVWLKASPAEHMMRVVAQGDQRPMMGDDREAMRDLARILTVREPMHKRADEIVDTTGLDQQQSFAELSRRLSA